MTRGARTRSAAWLAAAVLLTGLGAAGCGDDGGGAGTPDKTPSAQEPESSPAAEAGEDADDGAGGAEPADPAAAEKEIEENWTTFFSPDSDADAKLAVLEDGEAMRPLMTAFSDDKRWKQVGAEVTGVEFDSAEEAEVTYDIALKGETVVPGATGISVLQDGSWKVSKRAICTLVEMSGSPGPGC
ncbi:hypothetical protein AA958_04855 [Streptomyces sp. CNQ-509]|uniref:hypothetical protein n=1 Tax=unclassified Streptomyces TaxID=2593676 RepID=UPI00062DF457|nr:hypothetical protein [Streptomyces sp. CNQ-509]AKH81634.1 hypothetical protein AA958_04855 [Streptomyces sp. CNQ-509]